MLGSEALDIFRLPIHPSTKRTRTSQSPTPFVRPSIVRQHRLKMNAAEGEGNRNPTTRGPQTSRSAKDFIFGKQIGEGSFSTVYLAKDIHTSREWAVKVCDKQLILRERKLEYVRRERTALTMLSGVPGFLKLFCSFQDYTKLYFVTTYARNGTLLQLIERVKKLDIESVRFYSAQILLAIEEMHARNIIHRDLKPENVLLDEEFHIMIADFGSSRIDDQKQDIPILAGQEDEDDSDSDGPPRQPRRKRGSFVGTAQYVSPEILRGKNSTEASDLWSFGCILYQLVAGHPPFQGPNDYLIFQKINNLELEFPSDFNHDAKDLVRKLVVLEPRQRLGAIDKLPYESIRKHKFLESIDFSTIRTTSAPVPKNNAAEKVEQFPESAEPGLSDEQIARMLHQDWFQLGSSSTNSSTMAGPSK